MAAGVGAAYFFDRERGGRRRRFARQRTAGAIRHSRRRFAGGSRAAALQTLGRAKGALHRFRPPGPKEPLDDITLAHKVESIIYRNPGVPKGRININAENGCVFLRGQLDSAEEIETVAGSVARITDVREIVNLLHLPGTPAPHPPAGRR